MDRARRCRRIGALVLLGAAALLAPACGGDEPVSTSNERPPEEGSEKGSAEKGSDEKGPVEGDPDAVRMFDDPATEIETAEDLTEYLLPGMSGKGADCTAATLDPDEVLVNSREDGAWSAAFVVTDDCVTAKTLGNVVAMYATALEPSEVLPYSYEDIAPCVAREWADDEGANTTRLAEVFEARLDLEGPVTSPGIARESIENSTGCLDDFDDPGSTGPTTTAPTTTVTTAAPPSTLPTQSITMLSMLTPGTCLLAVPETVTVSVTTIDCTQPHVAEVVAAGLGGQLPDDHCSTAETNYSGGRPLDWPATIVTWTREDLPGAVRTVCLIKTADGRSVVGSVRAG